VSFSSLPDQGGGWWSQHMMGRGLVQVTGCFPNLDPGQNAPLWCMQGTSTLYTYHLTTHHWQVHRVVYVALLCDLCSRNDCQALKVHWYGIMRHIALLPDDQDWDHQWCQSSSFSPLQSPQRSPPVGASIGQLSQISLVPFQDYLAG